MDLVLTVGAKTYAVEIKSGRADQSDALHLEQFRHYYKAVNRFFLVTAEGVARKVGRVHIVNVNEFLRLVGL